MNSKTSQIFNTCYSQIDNQGKNFKQCTGYKCKKIVVAEQSAVISSDLRKMFVLMTLILTLPFLQVLPCTRVSVFAQTTEKNNPLNNNQANNNQPINDQPINDQPNNEATKDAGEAGKTDTQTNSNEDLKPVPRAPLKSELDHMRLLATELDAELQQWLNQGGIDQTNESGEFLCFYRQAYTPKPLGGIILLHGEGEHLVWPKTLAAMFNELPKHGWNVLSLSLPTPNLPKIPGRMVPPSTLSADKPESDTDSKTINDQAKEQINTDEPPPETLEPPDPNEPENEENSDLTSTSSLDSDVPWVEVPGLIEIDSEAIAQQRLQQGYSFMHQQGQFNLAFIAVGSSGLRALRFLSGLSAPTVKEQQTEGKIRPIQAIALINAVNQLPVPDEDNNITDFFTDPELNVFDILLNPTDSLSNHQQQRFLKAQQKGLDQYQTLSLNALVIHDRDDNRLIRRIRGYLNRTAKGKALKAKIGQQEETIR